jgi:hypothetical protein
MGLLLDSGALFQNENIKELNVVVCILTLIKLISGL